jgi:tetratricopeptide (TPR) repeat protein
MAYLGLDDRVNARTSFKRAVDTPVGQSEYLYYKARSQQELGQEEEAQATAQQLIEAGQHALETAREADFFAKFGEKAGVDARKAAAYYNIALGYQASGEDENSQEAFNQALQLKNSILWASVYAGE